VANRFALLRIKTCKKIHGLRVTGRRFQNSIEALDSLAVYSG
jgi:hypothetical protein